MYTGRCSSPAAAARFVNGKGLLRTGHWWMARAACRMWRGATRARWQGLKRLPTAWRFTRLILTARWVVPRSKPSLVAFMAGGSHLNWSGLSRAKRVHRAGKVAKRPDSGAPRLSWRIGEGPHDIMAGVIAFRGAKTFTPCPHHLSLHFYMRAGDVVLCAAFGGPCVAC